MDYEKFYDAIMKMVMPQSFPIGVKIIKAGEKFPDGVVRPNQFKIKVAMCQWTTLARRWGWVVGVTPEDINCTPCMAGFGFKRIVDKADFIKFVIDMGYFESEDLAKKMLGGFEPLEPGSIQGVVTFPLNKATVDPDLVLIYGTPAQMTRVAYGYIHNHGHLIRSDTGFGLSCLAAVMPLWRDEATFVHPGRGERLLSGTDDSEMFFSMPASSMEAFLDGLEKTQSKGLRYPIQGFVLYQPPLLPQMKELYKKLEDV
jgi:uncharacterized protein (DUF169 family)